MESYKGLEFEEDEIVVAERRIRGSYIFLVYDVCDDMVRFVFQDTSICDKFLSKEVDIVQGMLNEFSNSLCKYREQLTPSFEEKRRDMRDIMEVPEIQKERLNEHRQRVAIIQENRKASLGVPPIAEPVPVDAYQKSLEVEVFCAHCGVLFEKTSELVFDVCRKCFPRGRDA